MNAADTKSPFDLAHDAIDRIKAELDEVNHDLGNSQMDRIKARKERQDALAERDFWRAQAQGVDVNTKKLADVTRERDDAIARAEQAEAGSNFWRDRAEQAEARYVELCTANAEDPRFKALSDENTRLKRELRDGLAFTKTIRKTNARLVAERDSLREKVSRFRPAQALVDSLRNLIAKDQ